MWPRGKRISTRKDVPPQQITVLGKLRFGDLQSANHIDFKSSYLVVAAGLGGVKLVKVKVK